MFEYIRKVASDANQSLEGGAHELTQAVNILALIPERHKRMREIATEVGSLVLGASEDLDEAEINTWLGKQLLSETLLLLRRADGERISSLSARAVEAHAALQDTPGKLDYHRPIIRREFDAAFFAETKEAFQKFEERIAQTSTVIEEARDHQIAAIKDCKQSLENL